MSDIYQQIISIVTIIIGSVDITSVIAVVIYVIRQSIANKKSIASIEDKVQEFSKLNREQIEEAFKEAVLPKNIRLDVSSKIEKPIKEGLQNVQLFLQKEQERLDRGQQLILSILSEFSHVKKLPQEVQDEIEDYLEPATIDEVKIE